MLHNSGLNLATLQLKPPSSCRRARSQTSAEARRHCGCSAGDSPLSHIGLFNRRNGRNLSDVLYRVQPRSAPPPLTLETHKPFLPWFDFPTRGISHGGRRRREVICLPVSRLEAGPSILLTGKEKRKLSFLRCLPVRRRRRIWSEFAQCSWNSNGDTSKRRLRPSKTDAFLQNLLTGKQLGKLGFRSSLPVSNLEAGPSIFLTGKQTNRLHLYY
jgi:hypothetical protein